MDKETPPPFFLCPLLPTPTKSQSKKSAGHNSEPYDHPGTCKGVVDKEKKRFRPLPVHKDVQSYNQVSTKMHDDVESHFGVHPTA